MEIALIILGILIILALVWNACDRTESVASALFIIALTFLLTICLDAYFNRDVPTAIDVYNNKTTLEITYRDSVAIDTVVVYKPEFRKK